MRTSAVSSLQANPAAARVASDAQLILADGLCPKIAELLSGALQPVIRLDSAADPLGAISEALAAHRRDGFSVETLHLLAHGRGGAIHLGGRWIAAADLSAAADRLAGWQVREIALWSCEAGADPTFVALLEELTGARVFASRSRLGGSQRQWTLRTTSGETQTALPLFHAEVLNSWTHELVTVTFDGLYKANFSYDPTGFFGEETAKINIEPRTSTTSLTFTQPGTVFTGNNVPGYISYDGNTIIGLASRPIKVGGQVLGFYVWVDTDGSGGASAGDEAWVLSLDNTYFDAQAIKPSGPEVTSSSDRVDTALNKLLSDQTAAPPNPTRTVIIDDVSINEASEYAIFTLNNTGTSRQWVSTPVLFLKDNDPNYTASLADFNATPVIEYWTGSAWATFDTTTAIAINAGSNAFIRVGNVKNDSLVEGSESFALRVSVFANNDQGDGESDNDVPGSGLGAITGQGAILDNGQGTIFTGTINTSDPSAAIPVVDEATTKDFDTQPLSVTSPTVNEASPFAIFRVQGGNPGTKLPLNAFSLQPGTATEDVDYNDDFEYFDITTGQWVDYSGASSLPTFDDQGEILVRVPIKNDTPPVHEGPETFKLIVNDGVNGPVEGEATILDDGQGDIFPEDNNAGTGAIDPNATKDDDRSIKINNIEVNEASPYAVFVVQASAGQQLKLSVQNDSDGDTQNATIGTDTGTQLQVLINGIWKNYNPSSSVTVPTGGKLLVRLAVLEDEISEGPETFQLKAALASNPANVSLGTATIYDDGRGAIYPDNTTGNPDPNAVRTDDRNLQVDDITVNEASPFAVFRVVNASAASSDLMTLGIAPSGSSPLTFSVDNGTQLQYFDGNAWLDYTGPFTWPPALVAGEEMLVRLAIFNDDSYEGPETLKLTVTRTRGSATTTASGELTVVDDGTGLYFPDNNNGSTDPNARLDDDRGLKINNIEVNEGSPWGVFRITGVPGTEVALALQNDNDPTTADATVGTDLGTKLQYFKANYENGEDGAEVYGEWLDYNPLLPPSIDPSGVLLVRAAIINDGIYEGPETFLLKATPDDNTAAVYGTGTIRDDGTGNVWPNDTTGAFNLSGNPDPLATRDDDRTIKINSIEVNEGSPFGVFTLLAKAGAKLSLSLRNDTDPTTQDADLNDDVQADNPLLEYWNGTTWVEYNTGLITMPASGKLFVRIAVENDGVFEGLETLQLVATSNGKTSYGTMTIRDDGLGDYYSGSPSGLPATSDELPEGYSPDDDRTTPRLNNVAVNEYSEWAVFTLGALPEGTTSLRLFLANDNDPNTADARIGIDIGEIEYYNGSSWLPYEGIFNYVNGEGVGQPPVGEILIRVRIFDDTIYEGPETFLLGATYTDANSKPTTTFGVGTIYDDGRGDIWAFGEGGEEGPGSVDPSAQRNDDRLRLTAWSDSGTVGDNITSNGLPQVTWYGKPPFEREVIEEEPESDSDYLNRIRQTIRLLGADGIPLEQGTQYRVDISIQDDGRLLYSIVLLDADGVGGDNDPFGTYSTGKATGNSSNTSDGIYRVQIDLDGAGNLGFTDAGSFEIRTKRLSDRARANCLRGITKDGALDSVFFGYRVHRANGIGSNGDDVVTGLRGRSDTLNGKNGSDILNGYGKDSVDQELPLAIGLSTVNEVDRLTGGKDKVTDYFQLGDRWGSYYLDEQHGNGGNFDNGEIAAFALADTSYAIITDMKQQDVILLHGNRSDYTLSGYTVGVNGTLINGYALERNGDLIGIIQAKSNDAFLNGLRLNDANFTYL